MRKNLTRRAFLKTSGGMLASVYVMGLAGCSREQGGAKEQSGGKVQDAVKIQSVAGHGTSGSTALRIMAWNLEIKSLCRGVSARFRGLQICLRYAESYDQVFRAVS